MELPGCKKIESFILLIDRHIHNENDDTIEHIHVHLGSIYIWNQVIFKAIFF